VTATRWGLLVLLVGCSEAPEPTEASAAPETVVIEAKIERDRKAIAATKCKEYYDCAKMWRLLRKEVPKSLLDMEAPLTRGDETVFVRIVADPWGQPYGLERTGDSVRVRSRGPDRVGGTADDITYPAD